MAPVMDLTGGCVSLEGGADTVPFFMKSGTIYLFYFPNT